MTRRTVFYCRCGARLIGGDRVGHKCPTVIEAAQTVVRMLELGDERLLASDGPAGGQLPDLSPDEWGKVYRACKIVAKGLTKADVSCLVCGANMAHRRATIQHMDLPFIVVCESCVDAVRASTPAPQ